MIEFTESCRNVAYCSVLKGTIGLSASSQVRTDHNWVTDPWYLKSSSPAWNHIPWTR
jgi:hypothetical protein